MTNPVQVVFVAPAIEKGNRNWQNTLTTTSTQYELYNAPAPEAGTDEYGREYAYRLIIRVAVSY